MAESFSLAIVQQPGGATLCERCQEYLFVTGIAISLVSGIDVSSMCVVDERAVKLDEMQFTLGAGPTYDALQSGEPVVEDQMNSLSLSRWPELSEFARECGINGIFAFPLQIGAARAGVLTAYQRDPRAWSLGQHADALIAADALTHVILAAQSKAPFDDLADALREVGLSRAEVHQASGMLSAQAGVSVAAALVLLRSHAYAIDCPVAQLASNVIARKVRIDHSGNIGFGWREE